jgi:hypothetical protein
MSAFDKLADEPRWVSWRNEPRGNKLAKVPYGTGGRRAKADDPATWITRAEATDLARRIVNGLGGGVGLVFGDHGGNLYLSGGDIDSCIDEKGFLALWAEKILSELDTYAERSPSGTGIKSFFYISAEHVRPFLELIGVNDPAKWGTRRSVGEDDRNHGPAVEIYCARRYFAVTDNLWPGKPDAIALLDWPQLERLAQLVPQRRVGRDNSRSAKAFREGARLRPEGKSFEEVCDALRRHPDPDIRDWVREKGETNGQRELHRIWDKAASPPSPGSVPIITIEGGNRHDAADKGIAALITGEVPFYQHTRKIQRVALVPAKNTSGESIMVPGIVSVGPAMMGRALGRSAVWQRFDIKRKQHVRIDPPGDVAEQILSMVGEWPFSPLNGLTQCPTLRRDGTLLDQPGYDEATGLVLVGNVPMPTIPARPTREQALRALALLLALLEEFPFVDEESKAVALSMIMTPVLRGAMIVAPMHLVTKPAPGTGGSYLADCATMIATGERCAVESMAPNYGETEKRLIGSALAGFPIIGLDNCRGDIAGDFFCQIVERPLMSLRALGKSDKHRVPNTFTMFANGNNVGVAEDMVRRTIRSGLDANIENPEIRRFNGNPLAAITRNRGKYIAATLIIPLAHIAAGRPSDRPPLLSFEDWCGLVRDPLIWLGCADPVKTQEKLRTDDPRKVEKIAIFEAWKARIGIGRDRACFTKEIIEIAYTDEPLREALLAVAAQRFGTDRKIDPKALGKWLGAQEGTIAAKCKLMVDRKDNTRPRWYLGIAHVGWVG